MAVDYAVLPLHTLSYAQTHMHRVPHSIAICLYTVLMGANNGPMLGLQWQFMMDVGEFNWE